MTTEEKVHAPTPIVGIAYRIGAETIVPTYVRESETPRADGACVTRDYTRDASEFEPAGWFVEFRYPTGSEQYRRFVPFTATDCEVVR